MRVVVAIAWGKQRVGVAEFATKLLESLRGYAWLMAAWHVRRAKTEILDASDNFWEVATVRGERDEETSIAQNVSQPAQEKGSDAPGARAQ